MAAELLAHVTVHANVMEKIVALKDAVFVDHPMVFFRYERLQNGRADFWMIERAECVSDVVQQRAHNLFVVATVFQGERRGKQRMLETVDREAAVVAFE